MTVVTGAPSAASPGSSGGWGRNLLAGAGIALTLTGIAVVLLPFCTRTSGFVAAPGTAILGVGVLLIVMSAFFDTTSGEGILPGWRVRFGNGEDVIAIAQLPANEDEAGADPSTGPSSS